MAAGNRFLITVLTGDKPGAGTDCDVSIILMGAHGKTGEIKLDDKRDNFENNQVGACCLFQLSISNSVAPMSHAPLRWHTILQ